MFSLRFTVLLLFFLLGAYFLRLKGLEPYPAIIMPSGHNKVELGKNQREIGYTSLYSINREEEWEEVDLSELIYPIPLKYSGIIVYADFGLLEEQSYSNTGLKGLLVKLKLKKNRNLTDQEEEEVKEWLKKQLQEQNFVGSTLKIVQKSKLISIPGGEVLNEKIKNEKILYLD